LNLQKLTFCFRKNNLGEKSSRFNGQSEQLQEQQQQQQQSQSPHTFPEKDQFGRLSRYDKSLDSEKPALN